MIRATGKQPLTPADTHTLSETRNIYLSSFPYADACQELLSEALVYVQIDPGVPARVCVCRHVSV